MKNKYLAFLSGFIGLIMVVSGTVLTVTYNKVQGATAQVAADEVIIPDPNVPLINNDAFLNPANIYRPLRIQHGSNSWPSGINTAEKRANNLKELGFGGIVANVDWTAKYLQDDKQFKALSDSFNELKTAGYRAWIYDENGYPSGSANGLVVDKDHMQYQAVGFGVGNAKGNGTVQTSEDLPANMTTYLSATICPLKNGKPDYTASTTVNDAKLDGRKLTFSGIEGEWQINMYGVYPVSANGLMMVNDYGTKSRYYPNLLNKDAVQRFIDVTYAAYGSKIANFSSVVEAFFMDEPVLWTSRHYASPNVTFDYPLVPYEESLQARFKEKFGYDLPLQSLFYGDSDTDLRARVDYYELVAQMLSESFFGQLESWCTAHGVQSSGHLLLEEGTQWHVPFYGDYMKQEQTMGYPGFDMLYCIPDEYISNHTAVGAKYASSSARWRGVSTVVAEFCPVQNPDVWAKDHLNYSLGTISLAYFNGVTQLTSYYSQANTDPKVGSVWNTYAGRLGYMLNDARMNSNIAIYYPISTSQAYYKPNATQQTSPATVQVATTDNLINNLSKALMDNKLDYNFLSNEALAAATISNGKMTINKDTYKVLIMPDCKVMDLSALKIVEQFIKAGGKVIWLNSMPTLSTIDAEQAELTQISDTHKNELIKYNASTLPTIIDAVTAVAHKPMTVSGSDSVYVTPQFKNGRQFYYIVNTVKDDATLTFSQDGITSFTVYNPIDGSVNVVENGTTITGYRGLFVEPNFS